MGQLIDGTWHDVWYDTKSHGGNFKRQEAKLRNWITPDGDAGVTGQSGFKAEKDRYHLYVSLACPWAHRTLIFRTLKGLESYISTSIVSTDMMENGWTFDRDTGSSGDDLYQQDFLHQLYTKNVADYSGRVTVPVLWDKKTERIVSNESSEIIRMFNSAFDHLTNNTRDYYPMELRSEIDEINEFVYNNINNGVYRCGFATTQTAYSQAYSDLFSALDKIEARLEKQPFLVGNTITEADWRLFTTLVRFDAVYFGHFKCNQRQVSSYPNLDQYVKQLYQSADVAQTTNIEHIKRHYYFSHKTINPTQVIPVGPDLGLDKPHRRVSPIC